MENTTSRIELNDVSPEQEALSTSEKRRSAKMYFVVRDPATLPVEDDRRGTFTFLDEEALITPYGKVRLSHQLRTVKKGRSAALTTPLLREDETLSDFAKDALAFISDGLDRYPELLEMEQANAKKCSPTSVMYPFDKREHQLDQYFKDPGGDVTDEEIAVACEIINQCLPVPGRGRLRPLSIRAAAERLPSSTQWALPYMVHGTERMSEEEEAQFCKENGIPLEEAIVFWDHRPAYVKLAEEMIADPSHPGWKSSCCMGWRGDLGKPTPEDPIGTKQRVVWMYPHAISVLESMYYPVLTDQLRSIPGFAAWRNEQDTRAVVKRFIDSLQSESDSLAWAFDASGFDYHLPEKLIVGVSRHIVQPMFQEGTRELLERLSQYSMQCGMVTPKGIKRGRSFNRPSGSGGTNINDCLENMAMFTVVALRLGVSKEKIIAAWKEVMGDDAVYQVPNNWGDLDVAAMYEQAFGAIVNTDKENLAREFTTYLKRVYTPELEGAASFVRMALKSATYERPTPKGWSQYMTEVRWIDQLGQLSTHPKFDQAIEYYIARAPLKLGLALEGGVDELLAAAEDIAWKEAAKSTDQLLNVEDKTLDAELGIARSPGRALVIDYLRAHSRA